VDDSQIRIVESYRDYRPPFNVSKLVRTLLKKVPTKHLRGLDCVVLVSSESLSRKDRLGKIWSRKRKIGRAEVYGLYHYEWKGKPPWIEIRVDRIISDINPRIALWVPPIRAICFAHVLYHELGHHIHDFVRPEYREKEDVADRWSTRLLEIFLRNQYWYAMWPLVLVGKVRKWARSRRADG